MWMGEALAGGLEQKSRRGRAKRGGVTRLRRRTRVTLKNGLVVDLFAGGGGASTGIRAAIGREPDIALNHDELALYVHADNHPGTRHLPEDVWKTPPRKVTKGKPVYILWASPDCTHFSAAKGGKPKQKNIRALAHVVTRWAEDVLPSIIFVENVREFMDWGPLFDVGMVLDRDVTHGTGKKRCTYPAGAVITEDHPLCGHPIPWRKGETFRYWVTRLELLGYKVEWRVLDASSYGAPTKRRRLFIVARCDGEPITWPTATHGKGEGLAPLNTAASCIDWSIPVPSIFNRKKPLAKKTEWRIAEGIRRFVLENPEPFIVGCGGRAGQTPPTPVSAPVGTVTAKNDRAVVVPTLEPVDTPFVIRTYMHKSNAGCNYPIQDPLRTITSNNGHAVVVPSLEPVDAAFLATIDHQSKGDTSEPLDGPVSTVTTKARHVLVAPSLVKVNHGGMTDRSEDVNAPLSTVTAQRRGHALVTADMAPLLVQTGYGEREGQAPRVLDLHEPLGTVMATGQKHALVSAVLEETHQEQVAAFLAKHFGGVVGVPLDGRPMDTITATDHHAVVTATTVKIQGESSGTSISEPMQTIVSGGQHHAIATSTLVKLRGECSGSDVQEPMPTITASGTHIAEVRAFLTTYYSSGSQWANLNKPMPTITALHRLGIVVVKGTAYQIVDIGMRMLEPHELLAAQFGRFAKGYRLDRAKTKRDKVRLIGNSVAPECAEAVVRANTQRSERARRAA